MRQKFSVEIAAGGGMTHDEIAVALGISLTELRKKYERELSIGAHRRRMRVMVALFEQAKIGNVSAAKLYMANEIRLAAPPLPAELRGPERAAASPVKGTTSSKQGKKAQRVADAQDAEVGTEWEKILIPAPDRTQ